MRPGRIFNFRLCRFLGFVHPDILEETLTSSQIAEWEAYDTIEPMDTNYRLEFMLAQVIAVIVNLLTTTKEGQNQEPITALNFMPDWYAYAKQKVFPKPKEVELSPEEIEKQNKEIADKILRVFTTVQKGDD